MICLTAFTLCFNGIYTDITNSILFCKFDDNNLIQITFKNYYHAFKPAIMRTMVITMDELVNNKELYIVYLLSTLLTTNHGEIFQIGIKDLKEFQIYNYKHFNNRVITGYRVISKKDFKHLKITYPYDVVPENKVVSKKETFVYLWNTDPTAWNIGNIAESHQETKNACKKFYKQIMKNKSLNFLLQILSDILENFIEVITNELIDIEENVKKDSDEFYKNILGVLFLTDVKKLVFLSEDIVKMIICS
jgi:hypothetical protein